MEIWGPYLGALSKKKECYVFSSNSSLAGGAPLQIGQRKITRIIPRIDEWKWGIHPVLSIFYGETYDNPVDWGLHYSQTNL